MAWIQNIVVLLKLIVGAGFSVVYLKSAVAAGNILVHLKHAPQKVFINSMQYILWVSCVRFGTWGYDWF